jgi:hypothetical protein
VIDVLDADDELVGAVSLEYQSLVSGPCQHVHALRDVCLFVSHGCYVDSLSRSLSLSFSGSLALRDDALHVIRLLRAPSVSVSVSAVILLSLPIHLLSLDLRVAARVEERQTLEEGPHQADCRVRHPPHDYTGKHPSDSLVLAGVL